MAPRSEWWAARWAIGAAAIGAVVVPMLLVAGPAPSSPRVAAWWGCIAVFVIAWIAAQRVDPSSALPRGPRAVAWLAVQSVAAIASNALVPMVLPGVATGGVLLVMVAAQLGTMPRSLALGWIAAQSAALATIYVRAWPMAIAFTAGAAYAAFQLAMLGFSRLAERERSLRLELAATLAELTATRELLDASVRQAERVRIARELHDLLGHHLVALGLQLEAAIHDAARSGDEALRVRIAEARAVARLLMADVRAAVSDMREAAPIDLERAVRSLADGVPGPRVEVTVDPALVDGDGVRAAALLRVAQEAITNARRHAGARTIRVHGDADALRIADDGRGIGDATAGDGIRGMRERLEALGGTLEVRSGPTGTEVVARVPPTRSGASP